MATWIEPQTRNITRLFREASISDITEGSQWYADAFKLADALGVKYGYPVETTAGVIAALSPLQSWGANVNLAARFLDAGGLTSGYLSEGLRKAQAILDGAAPLTILTSSKVSNFYRSIVSAGMDGVCIDRHAYCLAVATRYPDGDIPTLTPKRYARVAECFKRAARILSKEYDFSISPAQVQSVTWVLWRRKFWSENAFNTHNEI